MKRVINLPYRLHEFDAAPRRNWDILPQLNPSSSFRVFINFQIFKSVPPARTYHSRMNVFRSIICWCCINWRDLRDLPERYSIYGMLISNSYSYQENRCFSPSTNNNVLSQSLCKPNRSKRWIQQVLLQCLLILHWPLRYLHSNMH